LDDRDRQINRDPVVSEMPSLSPSPSAGRARAYAASRSASAEGYSVVVAEDETNI
jgi:hypothetical protein